MKLLKRILKIAGYFGIILFIVLVFFAAFTQTQFFRDRIRIILVSTLSSHLDGTLSIGTLRGNFVTGFSADSLEIDYHDKPFVKTGRITCKYDPLTLLEKKITIKYFIIEQPRIHFVKSARGEWNIDKLIKPSEDTTRPAAFDWTIVNDNFELKNGILTLVDSTTPGSDSLAMLPATAVDYGNFAVKDVNLQFKATIRKDDYSVKIVHASFYSDRPQFELTHFKADAALTARGVSLTNVILQSGKSYLELDASLRGVNPFHEVTLSDLARDSARVQLKSRNIDFGELKSFLPALSFLEGSASIDLQADGPFGDLTLKRLDLKTYQSSLSIAGDVRSLHRPQNLNLTLFVNGNNINPSDASRLMPSFHLSPFDSAGKTALFVQFVGKPLDFRTKTLLRGPFGEFEADGTLNLERRLPSYDVSFTTKSLNLFHLIPDERIRTSLTSSGRLKGEGFSLDSINANLSMRADSSRVEHLTLDTARISLIAQSHRVSVSTDIYSRSMEAHVNGKGDFSDKSKPAITADMSLNSINLAQILNDPRYESNLTLRGTLSASGQNIDNMNGDAELTILPSTFQSHTVEEEELRFMVDQHDPASKRLSLASSIADVNFTGKFDLDLAAAALVHQTRNLLLTIQEHALPPESVQVKRTSLNVGPHTPSQRRMDFTYTMDIKNLEPVASLIEGRRFNGHAQLAGAIQGTDDLLSFTCKGSMDEFFIGSFDNGILLNHTTLDVRMDSLADDQTLERLSGSMNLQIGSGLVNSTHIDSVKVAADYRQLRGKLSIQGTVDSLYTIVMAGQTSVQPHTYVFDVENFTFSSGDYAWHNDQDVQLRLNYDGTRILHADMKRNNEAFSLTGVLHHSGGFDFTGALRGFDLGGLRAFLRNPELAQPGEGFQGSVNADAHLSGSTRRPILTFTATSDSIHFRQSRIGAFDAKISYDSMLATIDLNVRPDRMSPAPTLTVSGTVPVNLALSGVSARFPDEPQDLRVVSQGFDLGVLDPLVEEVDDLSGKLVCNVRLTGTPHAPEYNGTLALSGVSFIFTPNNIGYTVSAELEPAGDKIQVKSFVVRNRPQEGTYGEANFKGSLTIKDFQIRSFDLTGVGQLLLMTDATRKVQSSVYGTLFTETDAAGLSITGNLQRPYISGKLYVLDANLVFPPLAERRDVNSQLMLNYVVIDDTTKKPEGRRTISKFYDRPDSFSVARTDTPETSRRTRGNELFINRLRYNLTIETHGTTAIKMIFTPATSEELYAELEGKVTAVNDEGTPTIYGNIEISSRSYYNFIKKFDATGKLNFVGQWDNPELDIQALYEDYGMVPTSDSMQQQKVIVELNISGTRYEPKLVMGMKVQLRPDEDPVDWSTRAKGGDVQSDAISFIVTGKFRDQLTSRDQQQIGSFGSATGSVAASNLVSGILSDFVRQEFPFIRSAGVSYQGGDFQQGANVDVSANVGKGRLRVGGKILNDIGNANVSYQVSLGDVFNSTTIRNLFIEIQRRVEGENPSNPDDKKLTNEARLYYRFSF